MKTADRILFFPVFSRFQRRPIASTIRGAVFLFVFLFLFFPPSVLSRETVRHWHIVQQGESLYAIAQVRLGDGGRWKEIYELNRGTLSNPQRIRVGQVLRLPSDARVLSPPARGARPLSLRRVQLKPGETLMSLARRYLGSGGRWKEFLELNPIEDPAHLQSGTKLYLPPGASATPRAEEKPEPRKPAPVENLTESLKEAPAVEERKPPEPVTLWHVVQKGETLRGIARRRLGDPQRWREIARLNKDRLAAPGRLPVGLVLRLPPDARPESAPVPVLATPEPPAPPVPLPADTEAARIEREQTAGEETSPPRVPPLPSEKSGGVDAKNSAAEGKGALRVRGKAERISEVRERRVAEEGGVSEVKRSEFVPGDSVAVQRLREFERPPEEPLTKSLLSETGGSTGGITRRMEEKEKIKEEEAALGKAPKAEGVPSTGPSSEPEVERAAEEEQEQYLSFPSKETQASAKQITEEAKDEERTDSGTSRAIEEEESGGTLDEASGEITTIDLEEEETAPPGREKDPEWLLQKARRDLERAKARARRQGMSLPEEKAPSSRTPGETRKGPSKTEERPHEEIHGPGGKNDQKDHRRKREEPSFSPGSVSKKDRPAILFQGFRNMSRREDAEVERVLNERFKETWLRYGAFAGERHSGIPVIVGKYWLESDAVVLRVEVWRGWKRVTRQWTASRATILGREEFYARMAEDLFQVVRSF
ncbi:MAG: LysM peptidoglycan-binding domain-containing protein [Candidatus Hydrogenedentota bacterium]|nr:MAG: LysM peptidoglycan-binding domain-containing protein [Candidatus Hydrogenedentota bacterium]